MSVLIIIFGGPIILEREASTMLIDSSKPMKIKIARIMSGKSAREIAKALDMTSQQYYGYENGTHIPYVTTAIKIAQYYGVPVESLEWGGRN